ncbi:DUF5007 domain-containing protein [Sphingobacterium hungaricum]
MKSMNTTYTSIVRFFSLLLSLSVLFTSCDSLIPEDLDALGDDVMITTTEISPYLGRKTSYENIVNVSNTSTLPLNFKIVGPRTAAGQEAPELLEKYPVKVWTQSYTGEEKTLEEIESKRKIEYRPILDIQQKNGDIIFWNAGNSSFIKTLPDEGYLFDVEISNSGGRRYSRNLKLMPRKERDYEPSQYDDITGLAKSAFLRPNSLINIYGERTGFITYDVRVYIFQNDKITSPGNSLAISVLDSLGQTIDIQKFKDSNFKDLVHGFNHRFENGKVIYDVAYPMPLVSFPSRYTNSTGNMARMNLRYNRIGRGGYLQEALLSFDFAIYKEGHWEIQIRFNGESPKFENE